jgi:hypothetical protein
MANGNTVVQGGKWFYEIVATNKFGDRLVPNDADTDVSDSSMGTVSVNPEGTNCSFTSTGPEGVVTLTPFAGGMSGTPYDLTVVPDTTVANVTIVPSAADRVRIQPKGARRR